MKSVVDSKQIITSVMTAGVCGVIFVIIIPIIALFMLDVFITFISVFDPLHQGDNINEAWGAFVGIVIIQIVFSIIASIATGIAISYFTQTVRIGLAYLIGIGISVGIYCAFQFISIVFVGTFASEIVVVTWMFVSLAIVGFFSILIGLICVSVNRKMIANNYQSS